MLKCGSIKYLSFIKRNKIKKYAGKCQSYILFMKTSSIVISSYMLHVRAYMKKYKLLSEYFHPYFFGKDLLTVNLSTFLMKTLLLDTQLLGRMTDFALREHRTPETSFAAQERSLRSLFSVIHLPPSPITMRVIVLGSALESESVMFKNRFSAEIIYRFKMTDTNRRASVHLKNREDAHCLIRCTVHLKCYHTVKWFDCNMK